MATISSAVRTEAGDTAGPRPVGRAAAHVFDEGTTTVVCLHGEIDLGTVRTLQTALDAAVAGTDGDLVIDVGRLRFMDSSGLKSLLGTRERLALEGRTLTVRGARRAVRRIIEIGDAQDLLAA